MGVTPLITSLDVRVLRAPLPRPWGADVAENSVVVTTIHADDGSRGTGFGWTPSVGATAVAALLAGEVRQAVVGLPAHPVPISRLLFRALHEAGSGLTQIAAAAVDLALWDRDAAASGLSVVDRLGRMRDDALAYGSGVNLHYSIEDLVAQAHRWVAAGFDAVKIKVGRPDLGDDVDRVDAVREVIGPDRRLMLDANQRWDAAVAQRAASALERFGIHWLEEPLIADDTAGYARLRARVDVPIALGENAHSVYRFRDLIDAGACDVVQPNVVRVGGITPFLRIADLAETSSTELVPHLLPDVSAQLALTLARPTWVEVVEDADFGSLGVLDGDSPVRISGGRATLDERQGLGLAFREASDESARDDR